MQVFEPLYEKGRSAESGYECSHILGDKKGVHPRTAFIGFVAVGVEIAGGEVV